MPIDINDFNPQQQQNDHLIIETYITEDESNNVINKNATKSQQPSNLLDVGGGSVA